MPALCHQCGASFTPGDRFCASCGATVNTEAHKNDPLVGRVVGGAYVLQELVGVGGMGRVYRAEQNALGRTVAVKVIHPHLLGDDQTVARFYTEARAASRLNHPNSVSIIDFGRSDDGILYLVMEYLDGKDLAMIMQDEGPVPLLRACEIVVGALGALGEAHAFGVIHRDLKPENIILKRLHSGKDLVKVVDFGLATIVGPGQTSITKPGLVCGTPDYMSPEQGQGDDMDGRGDLYSMGVVLYELLTDSLPYEDETPTKVVLRHIRDPIPNPQVAAPQRSIPDELNGIVMKALAKKPEERFQNAAEMQEALAEFAANERRRSAQQVTCGSCGAPNPENMRFCGSCGARISPSTAGVPIRGRALSGRPSFYPAAPETQRAIVGRATELEQLRGFRSKAAQSPVWVHLCGEAGIGKTRLLRDLADRATQDGDFVAGARPHATRSPVPYGPVRALLASLLDVEEERLAALAEGSMIGDSLVRAGLREVVDPKGLAGFESTGRTGAVAAALHTAAIVARGRTGASRTILIVDDLGRCDGLTQAAMADLVRDFSDPGWMVATAGTREVSGAHNLALKPLPPHEARLFLAGCDAVSMTRSPVSLPESPGRAYLPLYLEQVHAVGATGDSAPRRLADAVLGRIDRMDAKGRRAFHGACVLGDDCSMDDLRLLIGEEDMPGLEQSRSHQLVQVHGDRIEIVHPFVRDLVEASIPAEARRGLHERALHIVSDRQGPLEVRAEHAYRAGESMTALVLLERMGDVAMQRGDAVAAVLAFRRALELGRREMLETGDLMLEQAMVTFSRKLGEALFSGGDFAEADGVLREALDLAGPASRERARMLIALGRVGMERDRRRDAMRMFGQALEVASEAGDELLEASVQIGIAQAKRSEGDFDGALAAYRRAVEIREKAGDKAEFRIVSLLELGETLLERQESQEALFRLSEGRSLAQDAGLPALEAMATGNLGRADHVMGHGDRARDRYREAARLAAEAGDAAAHYRWRDLAGTADAV